MGMMVAFHTEIIMARLFRALAVLTACTAIARSQAIALDILDGGAIVLNGDAILTSEFSGRSFGHSTTADWTVTLDRSKLNAGIARVVGSCDAFSVERVCTATPTARLFCNDTITTAVSAKVRAAPLAAIGIYTVRSLEFGSGSRPVEDVLLNGAWFDSRWAARDCTSNVVRGTNGNPSLLARLGPQNGTTLPGGYGMAALDDALMAHAVLTNNAVAGPASCSVASPPAVRLTDPYLALAPGTLYVAEFVVYALNPDADPSLQPVHPAAPSDALQFAMRNLYRSDLGVDAVQLTGTGTAASWLAEDLSLPGSGWIPPWQNWSIPTLGAFMKYNGLSYALSDIARLPSAWTNCSKVNWNRNYCYGSCQTSGELSAASKAELQALARRVPAAAAAAGIDTRAIMYMHPFLSTERNASGIYADSAIRTADGAILTYANCIMAPMFVGTLTNDYGKELLAQADMALGPDYGFKGIYMDESSYSTTPIDYATNRWDGRTAILDATNYSVVRHASSTPLVWGPLKAELFARVAASGGRVVTNAQPVTRSAMRMQAALNITSFVETSSIERFNWALYSPVGLAKHALGPPSDPVPKYNNVSGLPVDNLFAALDFGALTYDYNYVLPNQTGWQHAPPNVMAAIFPVTARRVGQGFVVGPERVITKKSGTWAPVGASSTSAAAAGLRVRTFDRNGWLLSESTVNGDCATVVLSDTVDIVGNTTAFFAVIEPRGGTLV